MRYRFADCELDGDRVLLTRGGVPVAVEPQVFDRIRLLAKTPTGYSHETSSLNKSGKGELCRKARSAPGSQPHGKL